MRDERIKLSKDLKGLIENPPASLEQQFRHTREAWEEATRSPDFSGWMQMMNNLGGKRIDRLSR